MSCSPYLDGLTDPLEILRVIREYHVLRYSEPSTTFYPLAELGWVAYNKGRWEITTEGNAVLQAEAPEDSSQSTTLPEFFEL